MKGALGLTLLSAFLQGLSAQEYYQVEEQLLASLKNNYTVGARPNNHTVVRSAIVLFTINKIDIGKEEMSFTGALVSLWNDPRLRWDPNAVGVTSVVAKTTDVWYPPLIIENNVGSVEILNTKAPLRIYYDGSLIWNPVFSPTTSCSADITYYPYDKQTCNITLVSWAYHIDEVELVTAPKGAVDLTYYSINGEWDLLSTSYHFFHIVAPVKNETYRKLDFQISVRRKWPYYGQNIMLPVVLNSFLMVFVFSLPLESGEKIGYCLTVLLSYAVLLTMVSANLPSISSQISILQMYLSLVMCLGTLSTMSTIGILRLYYRDEEKKPVPRWMQVLAQSCLAPLVCHRSRSVSPDDSETKCESDGKRIYRAKDIAEMMDSLFFVISIVVIITMTVTFIAVLMIKY